MKRPAMTVSLPGSPQPKVAEMLDALRQMAGRPDPAEETGRAVLATLKKLEGQRLVIIATEQVERAGIGLAVHPDVYAWLVKQVELERDP